MRPDIEEGNTALEVRAASTVMNEEAEPKVTQNSSSLFEKIKLKTNKISPSV
jgi:hypothetical protein